MAEKFILFKIAEKEFLISSECVFEILKDQKIYKLPFVPDTVYGVIDFRGTAFTVVNPNLFVSDSNVLCDSSTNHIILFSIFVILMFFIIKHSLKKFQQKRIPNGILSCWSG